jgi:hypothetical protein
VAAIELLVGIGIERTKAESVIASIPVGLDRAAGDVEFKRAVLTALLSIPAARESAVNLTDLLDLITSTGLTPRPGYTAPLIPVIAPTGPLVSGGITTAPDGAVVGGAILGEGEGPNGRDPSDDTPPPV